MEYSISFNYVFLSYWILEIFLQIFFFLVIFQKLQYQPKYGVHACFLSLEKNFEIGIWIGSWTVLQCCINIWARRFYLAIYKRNKVSVQLKDNFQKQVELVKLFYFKGQSRYGLDFVEQAIW